MLFFIFIIVLVLGVVGMIIAGDAYNRPIMFGISILLTIFGGTAVLVSSACLIYAYTTADAYVANNQQIYESLVYQYENKVFDNDDDVVGKKELYNQIQDWNQDLAYHQSIQDNFWVGIYYPNIFDQFEFIELS